MKPTTLILLAGLGLASIGCTAWSAGGGRGPTTGEGPVSTAELEEYLDSHPFGRHRDAVSFRLAMIFLSPDGGSYEPRKARNLLWQLAGRSPGPFRDGARQVLTLWTEVERLRSETAWRAEQLERLSADTHRLQGVAELAEHHVAEQDRSLTHLEEEVEKLRGKLWRARQENATQRERMDQLERELSELKRIDTGQSP